MGYRAGGAKDRETKRPSAPVTTTRELAPSSPPEVSRLLWASQRSQGSTATAGLKVRRAHGTRRYAAIPPGCSVRHDDKNEVLNAFETADVASI